MNGLTCPVRSSTTAVYAAVAPRSSTAARATFFGGTGFKPDS
jgi:hypothetical protein